MRLMVYNHREEGGLYAPHCLSHTGRHIHCYTPFRTPREAYTTVIHPVHTVGRHPGGYTPLYTP